MKYLVNIGALAALAMTCAGLAALWRMDVLGQDLSLAMLGLTAGPALVLGLYSARLSQRLAVLEAQLRSHSTEDAAGKTP